MLSMRFGHPFIPEMFVDSIYLVPIRYHSARREIFLVNSLHRRKSLLLIWHIFRYNLSVCLCVHCLIYFIWMMYYGYECQQLESAITLIWVAIWSQKPSVPNLNFIPFPHILPRGKWRTLYITSRSSNKPRQTPMLTIEDSLSLTPWSAFLRMLTRMIYFESTMLLHTIIFNNTQLPSGSQCNCMMCAL